MSKPKIGKLSLKKIRRTIFRNPLQFTAILLITILSTTLFTGLYGSVTQFRNQINVAKRECNTAELDTLVNPNSKNKDVNKELEGIKNTVGNRGSVESRTFNLCKVNSYDNYVTIYDKYPTISKDFYSNNFSDTGKEGDFFAVDYRYFHKRSTYGTHWLDENGKPYPINVSFPISSLRQDYARGKNTSIFDKFVKEGKKNIFDSNLLELTITPTVEFKAFSNTSIAESSTPVSFLSKSLFNKVLIKTIEENFDIPEVEPEDPLDKFGYKLLKDPTNIVTEQYFLKNNYLIKLNNEGDVSKVNADIKEYFNNKDSNNLIYSTPITESSEYKVVKSDLDQTIALTYMFPSVFMLVSLLVTGTTFAQLILKERNEIGTLKTLGVTKKRIITNYLILGLIIIFAGCLIGSLIGPFVIPNLLNYKFKSLYYLPSPTLVYPLLATLISSLIFLVAISLVIFFVSKKEADLPPSFTLRPILPKSLKSNMKKGGMKVSLIKYLKSSVNNIDKKKLIMSIKNGNVLINNNIEYNPKKKVDVFHDEIKLNDNTVIYKKEDTLLSLKLAIRNIRCSIPKSLLVLIGIAGCTAIVGGSFGINNTFISGMQSDLNRFLSSDLNLTFSNPSNNTLEQLKKYQGEGKEIKEGEPYSLLLTSIYKDGDKENTFDISLYGVHPESNFVSFGDLKLKEDRLIITRKVAEKTGFKVGDNVKFDTLGKLYEGTIYGIIDTFYIQGIFVERNERYSAINNCVTGAYIRLNKDVVKDPVAFGKKLMEVEGVVNFYEYEKNVKSLSDGLETLNYLTTIFIVFGIALGVVVLYNFILLTYNQRHRDIATMKVLGFNNIKLSTSVIYEILILSIVGITIGLLLALPFCSLILSINKNELLYFVPYVKPITYLFSGIITLSIIILISLFIIIKNKRIKMVESLKAIE